MTAEQIRNFSKEELKELYINATSITSLAAKLGSNRALLSQILYEKDIIHINSLDFEISEDVIIETYNRLSLKKAAKELGVKPNLLSVKLKKLGVLNFDTSQFWENLASPEDIQCLLDEGKTLDEIAILYNKTDTRSLRNFIKIHSLTVQPRRNQYGLMREIKLDDFGLSIIDYYNSGNGVFATAKYFNCCQHTIYRFLKREGIISTEVENRGISLDYIRKRLLESTIVDLAKELLVSKEELSLFCVKEGIVPGVKYDRDEIINKYYEVGSIAETARFFNMKVDNTAKILKDFGIDTSKKIATKEEIENSMKEFLDITSGIYSETGWSCYSGYDRDQLRHYFGSARDIKEYFNISKESVQDCFLNFFEKTFNVNLLREVNLDCVYPETNGRLRFDGYCKEWNLLIEYDDESHYFDRPDKWKTPLLERLSKDHYKDMWAQANDYYLIRIPFTMHWSKNNILKKLREIGCYYGS